MAFDYRKMETDRTVVYKEVEYRVLDTTSSGLLLVAKEEDVKNNNYPLVVLAIPEID